MLRRKLMIGLFSMLALVQVHANDIWQAVADNPSVQSRSAHISDNPRHYFKADKIKLSQVLSRAVSEGQISSVSQITLPVGEDSIQAFSIEESPIMAPELAAQYPEINTYKVYGIDDRYASGRLSMTSRGFHGMITSPRGTVYIDPGVNDTYQVALRNEQTASQPFNCGVESHNHHTPLGFKTSPAFRTPGNLREYRLAVAGTAEYVNAVGPGVSAAYSEIVVAINRVNQIYERDLAIRLNLVSDTALLYTDETTDPYTNSNGTIMLGENQVNLDDIVGSANYDVGHVFSTGGGGIAQVGSVCDASRKAQGVSGFFNPSNDPFYIDYVAHEIGHQFGAEHTFNGTSGNCGGGNRVASAAYEPGSGSTIMAYAGICAGESLQLNSDALFHAGSISVIDGFTSSGGGSSCGSIEPVTNPNEPIINSGSDFTIPRKTPFVLSAEASDADGDDLTYSWDQMNLGTATTTTTLGTDLGDNPLFRSYLPSSDSERHFPALGTTLQNKYDDSEVLACKTRDLNFRVTVRDAKSGLAQDDVEVSVDNASGPFEITTFETARNLTPGEYQLDWNVANTDQPPVSCSEVDISLLAFNAGKTSYSEIALHNNVPNNGTYRISVPDVDVPVGRFKLQCSDNIFYDISDGDLDIMGTAVVTTNDKNVFYNTAGVLYTIFDTPAEVCSTESDTPNNSNDGGGSGAFEWWWLLMLSTGFVARKLIRNSDF